ncbi:Uncharacterised protein [Mycobacteroides abscessus subsp. bolletii]|uniref:hypothetical protein n=1 Tax=Mycobacteroides abscessus TaxID=36809 RepID=UPI0002D3EEBF|nr:hypothetical protein [Mycobacteroides abscessus]AMU53784.1 hypothetical protein A3O02_00060 [Mycobacteroides abscessus]MBE5435437.1 hypothetical protein [Mycobacteroides abscessus]MBE5462755.1 hypothetical protein [Mycobacteroides abscessus]MBE5470264.1 hypothetical protein [Mycobacteroides abscessus]MBN7437929.1 hypothetical protein [Mycobacteroides abscessus subsp. abscessus]
MGSQTTDVGNNPALQDILKQAKSDRAGGTLRMEADAGKTMAKLILAARDQIDAAIDKANGFKKATGFGEADGLASGTQAVEHYSHQVESLKAKLRAQRDIYTQQIDHFIAMEQVYSRVDELSAENISEKLGGVQITVTS